MECGTWTAGWHELDQIHNRAHVNPPALVYSRDRQRLAAHERVQGSPMRRAYKVLIAALTFPVALIALVIGAFLFWPVPGFEPMPFDSEGWKAARSPCTLDSVRLRMADDLLEKHDLTGRSRADIVELLGEPDETAYFRHYDLVYHLGRERRLAGLDCEWLVIKLDSNGAAEQVAIATD